MQRIMLGDIFLNKTIKYIARVVISSEEFIDHDALVLSSTLVLVFDESLIEILVTQEGTYYKEILSIDELILDFELEDDEKIDIIPITEEDISTVKGATIGIASMISKKMKNYADEFLVMVLLWDNAQTLILALCTEGDEVELLSFNQVRTYAK